MMLHDALAVTARNILLLHVAFLITAPEKAVLVRQEVLKFWRVLRAPLFPKTAKRTVNRGKFWEIDMTKFEP
jgi:hypothetical protein